MRPTVIIALSAITLAAGAAPVLGTTIVQDTVEGSYEYGDFAAAADGRQFKVTVLLGEENAAQHQDIERAIVSSLQAAGAPGVHTTFVAGATSIVPSVSDYRFVVAINPGGTLSAEDMCSANPKMTSAPASQRMHVALSFCRSEDLLSTATAITGGSWQDHDTLTETMSQLMVSVVPTLPMNHNNHSIGAVQ